MKLAAIVVALTSPLALLSATAIHAQLLHSDDPLPTFEVATVRPHNLTPAPPPPPPPPGDSAIVGIRPSLPAKIAPGRGGAQTTDRVQMVVTAQQLIASAFNLPLGFEGRIEGGPGWVRDESNRYEIRAKIDDATFAAMQKLPPDRQRDQVQLMEQSLLADRFHLKVHFDTRSFPAYALVVAKGGPKLTSAKPGEITRLSMQDNTMTATAIKLDQWILAPFLGGRTILNQTGLTDLYDITLTWSERPELGNAPDLSTAIQQQLGLRLVPTKAPVEVVVIDSIDRPSDN
jgi:bla regulator protein blaR1